MVKRFFLFFFLLTMLIAIFMSVYLYKIDNKNTILLGTSLPLTGINKELGKEVIEGANTYFSHVNAKGGINGKYINLIFYDDKYEPQNTLINNSFTQFHIRTKQTKTDIINNITNRFVELEQLAQYRQQNIANLPNDNTS